jgi:6-hydroxytryprostatin B O-methyltransferase
MLNGYFLEPSPGQVAHSAMSLLLASSPSIQDYVGHAIGFSYPVSTKMVEMTERYQGSEAKTETAFNVAFDTPLPMFAWLKGEPEHSERFGRLMGAMKAAPVYSVQHLVNGYSWASLGHGKVVDVGGSLGHASLAVAERYPDISFVVQDLPEVVEQGKAKTSDAATEKLEFMPHDFFTEQPVKDADIYLLRQILHDWPDAEATTILKHLVSSMKPGSKIVIMDQVVPPPGLLPNAQEKAARTIDLVVMSHFNGKQRDMDDWKKIFAAVDEKLVVNNIIVQPGSVLSIIELSMQDTPFTNGHSTAVEDIGTNGLQEDEDLVVVEHDRTADEPATNGVHGEHTVEEVATPTEPIKSSELPETTVLNEQIEVSQVAATA